MIRVDIKDLSEGKAYMIKHEQPKDKICIFRCSEFYPLGFHKVAFYTLGGLYLSNGIWCSDNTDILRKGDTIYELTEEEFDKVQNYESIDYA